MSEFRRAKRRKVGYNVEIVDLMTEEVIGRLSNLSETGMLIIARQRLLNDALYQLRMRLPDAGGVERTIDIGSHELWSDDAAAPGQIWTGFRFIDISQVDMTFLRDWVDAPGSTYV
ncbi:MAG: PilZ domain-containing protein [Arenimonas sp.]